MSLKKYFLFITTILLVNLSFAGDLYWVGNSGNWTDASHWSNQSGGKGGFGIPTANDNVFIDQNSFTKSNATIAITSNLSINDFKFSENRVPFTINSPNGINIEINGNLDVKAIFTNEIKASIHFKSTQNITHELYFGWYKWKSDFYFEGSGLYQFKSPLQAHDNNINLVSGTVNLGGYDVLCSSFTSNSNQKRKLISAGSTFLAYNEWTTSKSKFNYDFSETTIYVISSAVNAVNLGGDDYVIKQSQNSLSNKTVSNASVSNDTVSCGNACDGSLIVDFDTDCANGSVDWLPGNITGECPACPIPGPNGADTLFDLCPGFYTAVISNDCDPSLLAPQGEVKGHPSIVELVHTENLTSCKDSCDGSIVQFVTGAPYASWTIQGLLPINSWETSAANNITIDSLCAGNYEVEVSDGFGCVDTFVFVIPEPLAVSPNVTIVDVLCFNECTGTATAAPTGGDGNYNYLWLPNGEITPGLTGLCDGANDSLTVTDGNGCLGDTTILISAPNQLIIDTTLQHVSCGGLCDGIITVDVLSGGTGSYTHNWSTGLVETAASSTINLLCFGTYTDSIVDGNGCDTVLTFVITEPTPLITSTSKTDVKCFGACDGTAETNTSGGSPSYTYVWSSIPAGQIPVGQGSDSTLTGLCPGQYIVDITDNQLCTISDTITITEPNLLVANPTGSDVSCAGVCDGTVTVTPTGGTGDPAIDFTYVWTGPGGPYNTQSPNSLCPGSYIVTVTDSNLCVAIDTAVVSEPQVLVLTMSSTDMSCFGVCDGTAGVVATGGTGDPLVDFTYTWASAPGGLVGPGQGTPDITGLCAGTFTVTIIDSAGCTNNNNTVVIEPAAVLANLTTTNITCFGDCNGTATVTPAGGNPPFRVNWDGAGLIPVAGSNTITGLCVGAHTVVVMDINDCPTTINFNVTEPPLLETSTNGTPLTCNAVCSGTATTTPTGGTAPYTYVWTPDPGVANGQGTPDLINLCAGTYFVTVTDDSLCTVLDSVVITEPVPIDPNAQSTNITCNGADNGTAIALPIGGTPPYASITWNTLPGGPIIPGNPIAGLSAGQYEVTVVDDMGCIGIDTVTITDPVPFTVDATPTNASCGTVCDGVIAAVTTGGTGDPLVDFTYQWDDLPAPGQTTATASNLCAGIYTVTVADSNGCIATDSDTVVNLVTVLVNANAVNNGCNTVCDGIAFATPGGGQAPYTFVWSAGNPGAAPGDTSFNLCQGMVYVTVTDDNGCMTQDSALVPAAPPVFQLNSSSTDVVCNGDCDGIATIAPSGGVLPYTILWFDNSTGNSVSNLCPASGIYWVTGTDDVGCIINDTITILQPDTIAPNPTIVNIDCNGNNTGSICLAPSGGVPGYTYFWSNGLGTNSCITNQPAGSYTVIVTDTNLCSKVVTYDITEPVTFSSNPISSDISCFGACDGMAGIILAGGTTPYSCTWSTGATTDTIFNLCPGPYSVTCTDSNLCVTTQNFVIDEPTVLDVNVTGTSIACGGTPCTGTATSTPLGGSPGYTWQWSTSAGPYDTSSGIINLCEDSFYVEVTDTNGCTANGFYIVTTPTVLTVTLDSTNITCSGDDDGTATATVLGGSPPYTYSWVGGCLAAPDTNITATGLCAGTYTVTVTDSLGCFFIGSVNIINPTPISPNDTITLANCGVCDGVIATFPSGGTPPYSHSWSNGDTTSTITGLCAGFYTDTITDFNGCLEIITFAVSNPTGPSGVTTTVNDATCFGACDGALNVIPIGGTPSYTYTWTAPIGLPNDSTLTGLCAGTYDLIVTDAISCVFATSIVVGEKDSITTNSSFTNATCNGTCDGTANVSPSGGTAPYTFLWSSGATGSSVSGLCVGPESVTITDFYGCTKVVNFNITSPNTLTLSSTTTDAQCNGNCDGTATVTPTGGTATFSYQWNDAASQTTQTATGLCAGIYIVTVSDFNGCSANDTITINEPNVIIDNVTTTLATCGVSDGTALAAPSGGTGPYTYLWCNGVTTPNVSGLPAGTCNLEITDDKGCSQTFLVTISNTTGPIVAVSSTNASCNGTCDGTASATVTSGSPVYTYEWSSITGPFATTSSVTGLCAGDYTVEVTDGNGCITVTPVTISDNSLIDATVSTVDATCNGACDGSALIVPSGGIPPYSYTWSTGHTINAVGGLCAGTHTVTITDNSNCSAVIDVVIGEPAVLTVNVAGINADCSSGNNGSATATPSGGTAPYNYLWSNNATTPTIVGLIAGSYSVTITDDKGCSTNGNVIIGEGSTISATVTSTDAICGVCDGTASAAAPTGGSGGPYTYLWLPGGQTTPNVSGLCPGAYTLDVADNAGCIQTYNVLINNPNGPGISASSDSVTCFGACDAMAWVEVTSGISPFTFQWDDPLLTINDTATNLCSGFYTIITKDSLGCISVDSTTVLEPQEILANISFTDPSCPGVCDGTATVNPTGGIGTLVFAWSNGQSSATATGLCAGTHTVTITDDNLCSTIDSIVITDPTSINITVSSTSPTCNGDCDATALATASGGTPGFTYSWNTVPSQPNSLAAGLCAGTYIVTVTDDNLCTDTASVVISDPLILSTTSVVTDATCNATCDGSVITNPAGGMGPYTYIWSDGQTTQTATGLCAGSYYVTVVDLNNCSVNDTVIVSEPIILNDSTIVSGPTCGVCDGSATSTPFGGVGPFDFTWTDPATGTVLLTTLNQASSNIIGLCAGTVNLEIIDLGAGCTYDYTVIVNSSTGPNISLTSTGETCIGACDGTATAIPTGGFTPYSYLWTPGTASDTNQTSTGLCANFYTVTVTDSLGCIASDTVTISTNGLDLSITNVTPETCFGDCDGSATVVAGAGVFPFTYAWTPTSPLEITPTATGLCIGTYLATVTDDLACSDSITTTITGPSMLSVTATINSPISCNAICDGSAIATATGGSGTYTYSWNDLPLGQTTQIATGLCAGTYIVTVTDDNNCTALDTVVITEPTIVVANEILTLPACNVCDGEITVTPSGGVGPFTFSWTTPSSPPNPVTNTITNLCAGAYSVDITDIGTGCITTFNFPLSNSNAPDPNTSTTNPSCNSVCDGEIISNPIGGVTPYTYSWNPGGTTNPISNLCAGIYSVEVTDSIGCIGVAVDTLTEPDILLVNATSDDILCNGVCDGWGVVHTTGGTIPYNTAIWNPGAIAIDSLTDLCAGTYYVSVSDASGCIANDSVTISEPTVITINYTSVDATCSENCDGSAVITPSGGTGTYSYAWLPGGQAIDSPSDLCLGVNTVTVTDQNNCPMNEPISIASTDTVVSVVEQDTTVCLGTPFDLNGLATGTNITNVEWFELPGMTSLGTTDTVTIVPSVLGVTCYAFEVTGACNAFDTICITVVDVPIVDAGLDITIIEETSTVLNGTGAVTYLWTPSAGLSDTTISNPTATPLVTTTYYLTGTNASGCSATDSVTVTVIPAIEFPDGITPNGDGKNDTWVIDYIQEYPEAVVEIYNRWGELLFHSDAYQNDWDGTYNGENLPIGTYYYVIELNDDKTEPFTGPLTVLR